MYVYNISGGVANIFNQSCAQIDNNQRVYEAQIQVPRCNSILKAVHTSVKSSGHFILIDVRVSTQTTAPRQLIFNVCMLSSVWASQFLLLDRYFHPSPNISSSIILIYTLFYYHYHHFYFYSFKGCIHQIGTKLLICDSHLYKKKKE